MNTTEIFDLAQLAEAAYGDYVREDETLITTDSQVQLILQGLKLDTVSGLLIKDEESSMSFSETQAIQFTDTWEVKAHQSNTTSGFSATLFHHKETGERIYAIRGTETSSLTMVLSDLVSADIGGIVTDGLAIHQVVDMYNDWQRLNAAAGAAYSVKVLNLLPLETGLLAAPEPVGSLYKATLAMRDDVIIDEPTGRVHTLRDGLSTDEFSDERSVGAGVGVSEPVTSTGHSLGGHLSVGYSRLFGGEAPSVNGAGYVTGDLPSLGLFADANIRNLFGMLGGPSASSCDAAAIHNIYGSAAPEFITQDGPYLHQQGSHDELWIESFSLSNVIGHGARQMTDSLAVEDLLMRVSSNNVDMQDDCQRPGVNRMAG